MVSVLPHDNSWDKYTIYCYGYSPKGGGNIRSKKYEIPKKILKKTLF
jgi:hypothetical protein